VTASILGHPAFLRSYRFLPHRLLNGAAAAVTAARRPRWAVRAAIRTWSRLEQIELDDFERGPFASLDAFFLRALRPGARPLSPGFVAPVDGKLVASGALDEGSRLTVKGQRLSVDQIVNAKRYDLDLKPYVGGAYAVIFLTPRGYHHVHMPCDATIEDVRWIPGRFYPQNETALEHIPSVYERNERAVLRARAADGQEFLLVMVGASLIGGIHLQALERRAWVGLRCTSVQRRYRKGERIGHFAFGSTVVVLLPQGRDHRLRASPEVRMGETLFESTRACY
jgi:phosphatidylserine decarboxylase